MDVQVNVVKSEEEAALRDHPLKPLALANGKTTSHFKSFESVTEAVDGEGIGKVAALCPVTPNPQGENEDSVSMTNSPLSLESPQLPSVATNSPSNNCIMDSGLDDSPRTPGEGIFDPFAPGSDDLLLAPMCKQLIKQSRKIVARRLNFDDVDDVLSMKDGDEVVSTLSENMLLDMVYKSLVDVFVLNQAEDFLSKTHPSGVQNLHTPDSAPRLIGISETCLGAPVKAFARKSRDIDPGLCRKLEF